jgi:hypothetical protein
LKTAARGPFERVVIAVALGAVVSLLLPARAWSQSGAEAGEVACPNQPYDVDVNGAESALSDGLLVMRHLFGFSGRKLVNRAIGPNANRPHAVDVSSFLDCMEATGLDPDGDSTSAPLSDGLLLLRYLAGLRGATLIGGAVGAGCSRCDAPAIEAFLACPTLPAECVPPCGDQLCSAFEDPTLCAQDCTSCGDSVCDVLETPALCSQDCGVCGDGDCDRFESYLGCPGDCHGDCGDGVCEEQESVFFCPHDCMD